MTLLRPRIIRPVGARSIAPSVRRTASSASPAPTSSTSPRLIKVQAEQEVLKTKLDQLIQQMNRSDKARARESEAIYAVIAGQTSEDKAAPPQVLSDLGKEFIRALVSVFATAIGTYVAQRVILRVLEQRSVQEADKTATKKARESL